MKIGHQKTNSVDANHQPPLINPWVASNDNKGQAPSTTKNALVPTRQPSEGSQQTPLGGGAPAVTNITNIIYNFNLTPSQ